MRSTRGTSGILSRAEWDASRRQKARDRTELRRLVDRGVLTATQANRDASLFQPDDRFGALDLEGFLDRLSRVNLERRRHAASR
jgi:hypothetical protein